MIVREIQMLGAVGKKNEVYDTCLEFTYTEPDEDKVFKANQDQFMK